jgi:hypothetical protein
MVPQLDVGQNERDVGGTTSNYVQPLLRRFAFYHLEFSLFEQGGRKTAQIVVVFYDERLASMRLLRLSQLSPPRGAV